MKINIWKVGAFVLTGILLVGAGIYLSRFLGNDGGVTRPVLTGPSRDSRTIKLKAALVYKVGVQPVARAKFYLLSTDLKALNDDKNAKVVFMQPSLAKQLATQGLGDGKIGLKEENIREFIVAGATTDFDGNAQFNGIAPGSYFIGGFTTTRSENGYVVWSVKVNTETDGGVLLLDQNNAFEAEEW